MKNYLRGLLFLLASLPLAGRAVAQKWVAGNQLNIGEGKVDRVMVGDLDADGAGDVVTLQTGQLKFYKGDGSGGVSASGTSLRGLVLDAAMMPILGADEAVVLGSGASGGIALTTISVTPEGVSETALLHPGESPAFDDSCKVAVGRFVHTEHLDVIVGCPKQKQMWVLDPDGETAPTAIPFEFPDVTEELTSGDIRASGLSDLAISGRDASGGPVAEIAVNTGSGSFVAQLVQVGTSMLYTTDYNGDTASDLLVVSPGYISARASQGAALSFKEDQLLPPPAKGCEYQTAAAGVLLDRRTHNGLRGQDLVTVLNCGLGGASPTHSLQIFRNIRAVSLQYSFHLEPSDDVRMMDTTVTVIPIDPSVEPSGKVQLVVDGNPVSTLSIRGGEALFVVQLTRETHRLQAVYTSDNGFSDAATSAVLMGTTRLRTGVSRSRKGETPPSFVRSALYRGSAHLIPVGFAAASDEPSTPLTMVALGSATTAPAIVFSTSTGSPTSYCNCSSYTQVPTSVAAGSGATFTIHEYGYYNCPAAITQGNQSCNNVQSPAPPEDIPEGGNAVWFVDGVYSGLGTVTEYNQPYACGPDEHVTPYTENYCPAGFDSISFTTPSNLTPGSHTILVQWDCQSSCGVSGGGASGAYGQMSFPLTVTPSPTTTISVSASANPINYGGSVTFVASISSGPTGSISFLDGGTVIGTGAISGTTASFTTSSLSAGSHSITASWAGNGSYTAATSAPISETVNKLTPTISVSCAPNPLVFDNSTTCTEAQSAGTGTVTFLINGGQFYNATWSTTGPRGSASGFGNSIAPGSYTITVNYSGDATYNAVSASTVLTLNKATPSISVGSSASTINYGSGVTFTASVSSGPTGSVNFLDGGTVIGSAPLSGTTASFTTATLGGGGHSITAVYTGNADYNAVGSGAVGLTVNKVTPSISVSCSPNPLPFATTATCTESQSAGTGTVAFYINGGQFNNALWTTTGVNGSAAGFANVNAGAYTVTVNYSGDGNYNPTSASTVLVISKASPSVVASISPTTLQYGQALLGTATVSCGYACGTADFVLDGVQWGTPSGTSNLGSNGVVSVPIPMSIPGWSQSVGTHTFSANFFGDANDNNTTANTVSYTVTQANTAASLATSVNPTQYGQATTLTALVHTAGAPPTGTVTFTSNGTTIGTGTVSTVTTTNLNPSTDFGTWANGQAGTTETDNAAIAPNGTQLAAVLSYPGTTDSFSVTSTDLPVTVGQTYTYSVWLRVPSGTLSTRIGINQSNSSGCCTYSTLPITVTSSWQRFSITTVAVEPLFQLDVAGYNSLNGIAAGTLEMWGPQLEQASTAGPLIPTSGTPATGSGGIATFTTSNLPVGTEALVATYSGDANDTSATSNTVAETVNKASSITILTAGFGNIAYGAADALTAVVNTAGGSATGTVTFSSNGVTLGSVPVSSVTTTNLLPTTDIAAWGLPPGTTVADNASVAPNGNTTAASLNYPGNADSFAVLQNIPATAGQAYTFSVWLRVTSGSLTTAVGANNGNLQTVYGEQSVSLTTSWQRFAFTFTPSQTTISTIIGGYATLAGLPAGSIQVWGPQLEQATFAGPFVSTAGAAASGSGAVAQLNPDNLPLGTDVIVATYSGDANTLASTSNSVNVLVSQSGSMMSLSTNRNPVTAGQPLTLTALVNTVGATPTGTVAFTSNGSSIGSGSISPVTTTNILAYSDPAREFTLEPAGTAATITDYAATGPDGYSGDAASFSYPAYTDSYLQALNIPGGTAGEPYTFSVWMRVPSGTLSTYLTLVDGAVTTEFGQQAVVITTTWQRFSVTGVTSNGTLTPIIGGYLSFSSLPAGTIQMWGAQVEQASAPGPYVETNGISATGSGGIATLTTSTLAVGTDSLVASYAGDVHTKAGTSNSVAEIVNAKPQPTMSVSCSPNPVAYGSTTTCNVTQSAGTGTISWTFDGSPWTTSNVGQSVTGLSSEDAGTYTVTANYSGDATYNPTSASTTLVIQQVTPSIAVSCAPSPVAYGAPYSCTAALGDGSTGNVVWSVNGGSTFAGNYPLVSGQSVLSVPAAAMNSGNYTITAAYAGDVNNKAVTGTAPLTVGKMTPPITWLTPAPITYGTALSGRQLNATSTTAGTYTYTPAAGLVLGAGTRTLSVSFAPTNTVDYNSATATVSLVVNQAAPAITVTCAPGSVAYNQTFTCSASVGTGTTGTVTWSGAGASGTTTVSGGMATFTGTATGNAGVYTITAAYGGDSNNLPESGTTTLIITPAALTLTWPSPAPITYGTPLSATQLNASSGGVAGTFIYTPSAGSILSVGAHTVSVLFIPANSEEYGSATTSTTITVTRAPVQIAITSSLNPSPYGMSVVFSIHLTGPAGTVIPTGTAQLSDGTQPLGPVTLDPLGNATYSVSTWHAGSHALNVAYQGDPNFF